MQISNMFGVTLDYLLKSEGPDENNKENGYYVSRETIDGFLSHKRHLAKNIAIGVGLVISSDIFGCFSGYMQLLRPLYWGTMAIGIAVLVWTFFQPRRYKEIISNTLLFDETVIKSFREESNRNRKRYVGMIVLGVIMLLFGSEFLYMVKDAVGSEVCNALDWLIDAASVMLLIIAGIAIHAENIITRNADYIAKKNSHGKFTWIYIALPATVLAVLIGIATNAWSPVFPVIQQLSQVEVYSADGNLLGTVTDEDTLLRFSGLHYTDISSDTDAEMDILESKTGDLKVLYTIISYKASVAVDNDGNPEKLMELTVYEDSNIIKEQIAPETIKGGYVAEEFLTFYTTVSDEDKEFILSLTEIKK